MEISQRTMTRAEFSIPDDAFVFCCFNSHYKITPELFDIWMRILVGTRQCGVSTVLWLTGGSETLVANLRREAEKRGIDGNRLFFTEKLPNSEYLARYRLADLFLDTFIYNAGSTAISALYAGVPVLTRPGNTNASRMGASICAAAELKSLICQSSKEYEQQAIYMAIHPLFPGLAADVSRIGSGCFPDWQQMFPGLAADVSRIKELSHAQNRTIHPLPIAIQK